MRGEWRCLKNKELFKEFRQRIYESFRSRADALLNLLDSLSGREHAESAVDLSLEEPFERQYSSLHDAVDNFFVSTPGSDENASEQRSKATWERAGIMVDYLPRPLTHSFWLFGIDTTPALRPYSDKLEDRGVVYHPNPAPGNKPIGVGHSYSVLALLPEREAGDAPWVVPMSCERVPTDKTPRDIAAAQVANLMDDDNLPFAGEFTVEAVDSYYSRARYMNLVGGYDNHVVLARLAANRVLYRKPVLIEGVPVSKGHPKWYGESFDLKDETTWGNSDEEATIEFHTHKERLLRVKLERWNDLLMRGKRDAPMHEHLFDVVRCRVFDEQGNLVFKRPMWLMLLGKRRREVSLIQAYEGYRQRFDIEHFFRFGKNRLLFGQYQTSEIEHEENWWELTCLAYTQMYLAAPLATNQPKPWERYLPQLKERRIPGPGQVQRDFRRIIRQFGTPACSPKRRGNSPGRIKGESPGARPRRPVVFKSKSSPKKAA